MICLDTNAVILLINNPNTPARIRFDQAVRSGDQVAVSAVVLFELWYGVAESSPSTVQRRHDCGFFGRTDPALSFDAEDAREAGDIRAALERSGKPIGPYDVLIAAQARRRGATLVTANRREFARVPGLKTENWAA